MRRNMHSGKAIVWIVLAVVCVLTAGAYLAWSSSVKRTVESDLRDAWAEYTQKTGRGGAEMSPAFVLNGITPTFDANQLKAWLSTRRDAGAEVTHGKQQSGEGYVVVQCKFGTWSPGSGFETGEGGGAGGESGGNRVLDEQTWIRLDDRGHPVWLKWSISSPATGAYARREIDVKTGSVLESVGPTEFPFARPE